jgi:hypothetical protein
VALVQRPVNCRWNKYELSQQWKESVIVPICKKGDKTVVIVKTGNIIILKFTEINHTF